MKVINVNVDRETYQKLLRGERGFDVRVDIPEHEVGDLLIYTMMDAEGLPVEGANIAFLIQTKAKLEEFITRIGEQMMHRGKRDSEDLIIITLSQVPGGEGE